MRLLSLLFVLGTGLLTAQTILHVDRSYHAAGEVLRFGLFLPEPAPTLVRIDIHAPDGKRMDYFFLPASESGVATGHYRWPYELPTGYYRLAVTALSAEDQPVGLGTFQHAVYALSDRRAEGAESTKPGADGIPVDQLQITVSDSEIVLPSFPAGPYGISVVNQSVLGTEATLVSTAETQAAEAYRDTLFYFGQLVSGDDGASIATNLLPFFDLATLFTYFSKSERDGTFLLTVPPFTGERRVQIRPLTTGDARARILAPTLAPLTERPPLSAAVLDYLDFANRRKKIFQLYGTVESPLHAEATKVNVAPLTPNETFHVPDYRAFPDLATFFREVAGELRVRQRKGTYEARLYNAPNQRFFTDTPLFIVDGRLTQDLEYVMNLKPADVERVSFFYENQYLRRHFPALGRSGVVRIDLIRDSNSFPAADEAAILRIQGMQAPSPFKAVETPLPRISPLRLWRYGTHAGGDLRIGLPETDDPGQYTITVLSQDAATGAVRTGRGSQRVAAARR